MTLFERVRYRLQTLRSALGGIRRDLHRAWTMAPIAGAEEPDPDPDPDPDPKPDPDPDPKPGKTFSQEDVDRIVQQRLKQAEPKYAELRDKAQKYDQLEEQNKSELEKAQTKAQEAEQQRDEAVQRANNALIRAAVIAEASKQGAVDPDAVVALLPSDAVTVGDDGQVTGAEEAVKGLLESKQYLVGDPTPPGPGDGGPKPPAPPKDLDAQIAEADQKGEIDKAMALKSQKLAEQVSPGGGA